MPNKYRIIYLPVAERDLSEIFKYIRGDGPSAASAFLDKLDANILQLEDFPELGKIPHNKRLQQLGYIVLIIESYLVFYVVKKKNVEIRRILHGRRRYEFLL